MEKYKKCKLLIVTDKKTGKQYSFPKNRKYLDFKKFQEENDPASHFWNIVFDPIDDTWFLWDTINGIVDDKLKPLADRFRVSAVF